MIKSSGKWLAVEEKLADLRKIVDENWDRGEWEMAVLGTGVIRVMEQSKANAMEMRQRADDFSRTFEAMLQRHEGASG
ncbi:MAG: hypothetical protein ISS55_06420 [Dehalococcoidales bacterium]|nr:hypothetical protein [Dehalococcoidales bacterium]